MEIGFLGLGAMGRAMAANLLSAGHRVRAWNRSPGPAQELATLGAERAWVVHGAGGFEPVWSTKRRSDRK